MSNQIPSGDSSLKRVKLIGRVTGAAVTGVSFFFRALSRGKKLEPAPKRAWVVAPAPQTTSRPSIAPESAPQSNGLPAGVHLPHPTIWPLVLSLGVTLVALGIVTNLVLSALGILCMIWAIAGWVGDLRHDG